MRWCGRSIGADALTPFGWIFSIRRDAPTNRDGVDGGLVRVNATDAPAGIPEPAAEFVADLKDALLARKDGGFFSRSTDYSVELLLGEERQP